jgi:O-antigen/teichoic acid export membrane protein
MSKASPFMSDNSGLAKKTVKNALWNYGTFATSKGVVFISTIILARVLAPDDFGLMALGLTIMNYLDIIGELGIGAALVYRQDNPEKSANVAFALSVTSGILLTAGAWLIAPGVAAFFNEPRVTDLFRVLALGLFISSLGNIHSAILSKQLDFRRHLIPQVGRTVVKGVVSVVGALVGLGVWSLVWGQIAGILTSTILYWIVLRWRPRFTFDLPIMRALAGYGVQIVLASILGSFLSNVDYLFIGRLQDSTQLGLYTMGFRLPELVILSLVVVIGQAIFPTYARLQGDKAAIQNGYIVLLRYISMLTVPVGVGMFLIAPDFVLLFYTERWAAAIPVMQVLALYAVAWSLSYNAGDIYKATGRARIINQIAIVRLLVTVPVLWIAAQQSIYAVALGQLFTAVVLTVFTLVVANRALGVRFGAMLDAVMPAALSAVVMFVGTTFILQTTVPNAPHGIRLAVAIVSGAALYLGAFWLIRREAFLQAFSLLKTRQRAAESS